MDAIVALKHAKGMEKKLQVIPLYTKKTQAAWNSE